jgi:hypothetical protein
MAEYGKRSRKKFNECFYKVTSSIDSLEPSSFPCKLRAKAKHGMIIAKAKAVP